MIRLFRRKPGSRKIEPKYRISNVVKNSIKVNLRDVTDYYRATFVYVPNDNLFVRLLSQLDYSLEENSIEELYDYLQDEARRLARYFEFHNGSLVGVPHKDVFALGIDTHFIAISNRFNPQEIYDNPDDFHPIKIIDHPLDNLDFPVLNGREDLGSSEEPFIVTIDIALLAFIYYTKSDHTSLKDFICNQIITSLFGDYINLALVNRFIALDSGTQTTSYYKHPIPILNVDKKINRIFKDHLKKIKSLRKKDYEKILLNLDGLDDSFLSVLNIEQNGLQPFHINEYILLHARLRVIVFLLEISSLNDIGLNANFRNDLVNTLKELKPKLPYFQQRLGLGGDRIEIIDSYLI